MLYKTLLTSENLWVVDKQHNGCIWKSCWNKAIHKTQLRASTNKKSHHIASVV